MDEAPATRASLLVRIRDGKDGDAWGEFVRAYAPVVYGYARKRGLQDADAADLMQEVLRSVAGAAAKLVYDPARGSFRGWLFTVTRNKLYTFLERYRRHPRGSGDEGSQDRLEEHPAPEADGAALWDREYETRLAGWAMERVRGGFRDHTWRAFHLTAVEGKSAREAGETLGMSPGAVLVAKSRVLARLRQEIQQLQGE
jgi:RNA polymerase sigma factor (sigma-70 family)